MRPKPPSRSSKSLRSGKVNGKILMSEKKPLLPKPIPQKEKVDSGLVRKALDIHCELTGAQLCELMVNGTTEIKEVVSNECGIIYECRVCRNLFRSIANLLTHKRTYCTEKFNDVVARRAEEGEKVTEHTLVLNNTKGNTLLSRTTTRGDILALLDNIGKKEDKYVSNDNIVLKELNETAECLFNCYKETQAKSPQKYKSATLGSDGRVIGAANDENDACVCSQCHQNFPSTKALTVHLKAKHGNLRICYICPVCKKYFANTWSLYRHLYSIHRKSSEQVRKLRSQIQKKQVTLEELNRSKAPAKQPPPEKPYDQDKAWLDEVKGSSSELMPCMGCGKKFERKVALVSHAQTCQKQPRRSSRQQSQEQSTSSSSPASSPTKRSGIEVRMYYGKILDETILSATHTFWLYLLLYI